MEKSERDSLTDRSRLEFDPYMTPIMTPIIDPYTTAPVSLSQFSDLSLSDDFLSQSLVGWLRRGVVDARPAAFCGPMGKLELYFKKNVMDDLWLTVKWGKT